MPPSFQISKPVRQVLCDGISINSKANVAPPKTNDVGVRVLSLACFYKIFDFMEIANKKNFSSGFAAILGQQDRVRAASLCTGPITWLRLSCRA